LFFFHCHLISFQFSSKKNLFRKPKEIYKFFLKSFFDLSISAQKQGKNWHLFSSGVKQEKRGCQGFAGLIPSTFLDK